MAIVKNLKPTTTQKAQEMTLDQFMKKAGGDEVNRLVSRFNGGTYSGCHVAFYEATGIWIPELVPVFAKLDAMSSLRGPVPHSRTIGRGPSCGWNRFRTSPSTLRPPIPTRRSGRRSRR